MNKTILFLTGTRADFGKIKPLIRKTEDTGFFRTELFVTGMHMLSKYGSTVDEVRKEGFKKIYTYINQTESASMALVLASTITGLSNYVSEFRPDMIIVHGDRVETLAGAIVGSLNNTLVAHIEGGEVSGTIDELLRHSITKLSQLHFVANESARKRLIQMGEVDDRIHVIGSPDLDIMLSNQIPTVSNVKLHYGIEFDRYAIFIYHPVTTEHNRLRKNIKTVISALVDSERNYIVVKPNNDFGTDIIAEELKSIESHPRFKVFPSLRFEYFLSLLKHCDFIIGNSSAGIREAEVYGKTSINIGSRQQNRHFGDNIVNVDEDVSEILAAIETAHVKRNSPATAFGDGRSADLFLEVLMEPRTWEIGVQKYFVDIDSI